MDKKIFVGRLRELCRKSRTARGWNPSAKNAAISLCLEASELLEHFQWDDWKELLKNKKKREEIELEVGDIIYYLCEFADKLDIDLSESLKKKLKKIDEKYPAHLIKKHGMQFYYNQKKKYRKEGK
ncbi:hypothetical protein A2115_01945 [Candidatus Woesebacteria bacterium GWA1_41_8]|uniref:Nucleotide pyrophosphohydrolase n=1 Tax=Candidatus Woesebacteria bacterium GWA1_41_8 TaxID=1802471 RepID=A0A1F7WHD2_9BACT|nr:MAG: hypothetical protein A2115_01945 [Candidatus Woesebacteria bacterium GWA1_41_8]